MKKGITMPIKKFRTFGGKRYRLEERADERGELDPLRENYIQVGYYVRIVEESDGFALYAREKPVVKQKASDVRKLKGTLYKNIAGRKYRLEAAYHYKRSAKQEAKRLRNIGWNVRIIELPNGWGVYKNW